MHMHNLRFVSLTMGAMLLCACIAIPDSNDGKGVDKEPQHLDPLPHGEKTGDSTVAAPVSVVPNERGSDVRVPQFSCGDYDNPVILDAWFGGTGGGLVYMDNEGTCWNKVYYGVQIALTSDNRHVLGVQLAYYYPSGTDLLYRSGDFYSSQWAYGGGAGYNTGWSDCPAGSIIVGVRGNQTNTFGTAFIDSIGFACKSLINGSITMLPEFGASNEHWYELGCDWYNAVLDVNWIRKGLWWDAFEVWCRRPVGNTVFWLQ